MSLPRTTPDQTQFEQAMRQFQTKIDGKFGVMVHDLDSGLELRWNENDAYPTASTMKVPLLYELYRQADAGEIDLSERVTLRHDERVPGSGVLQHLSETLQPTVHDLAELMIIVSDNYATDLLYEMVGGEWLAATMDELGLHQTRLPHTTWQILSAMAGIDPEENALSYEDFRETLKGSSHTATSADAVELDEYDSSSPADMVRLLCLIEEGHGLSSESREGILEILKHQNFNQLIPGRLPDDRGIETAHKTGSVRGVRNDVGLVYAPGVRYAIAIMSKQLDDPAEAVAQFALISRWVWDHLTESRTNG